MFPEYLHNNDTEEITRYVRELVASDELALRAHCQEVSRQTDTSALYVEKRALEKAEALKAVFSKMAEGLRALSQSLSAEAGIFHTQDGQTKFSEVCRSVVRLEEERQEILRGIIDLSQVREELILGVSQINRALHFLSIAESLVPKDVQPHYKKELESVEALYACLLKCDTAICEIQTNAMTMVESHLPRFTKKLYSAADFSHAGNGLDRAAIRSLCGELLILLERLPKVAF